MIFCSDILKWQTSIDTNHSHYLPQPKTPPKSQQNYAKTPLSRPLAKISKTGVQNYPPKLANHQPKLVNAKEENELLCYRFSFEGERERERERGMVRKTKKNHCLEWRW